MKQTPHDERVKALQDKIAELTVQHELTISPLVDEMDKLNRLRAHLLCPFAVGDTVTNNGRRRILVEEIRFQDWGEGWDAVGRVLRKDGTPGRQKNLMYYEYWKKVEEPTT